MSWLCVTLNVLADEYFGYGTYHHALDPGLELRGARTERLAQIINGFSADVVGLQEVEPHLMEALRASADRQMFWSPKTGPKQPDGCLMLVRNGIDVRDFRTLEYSDGSGHVAQLMTIGEVSFVNTHIEFEKEGEPVHAGVLQTRELLAALGDGPVVILADCNGRPGGRVRSLFTKAGFTNVCGVMPTALVNGKQDALDLVAVRGLRYEHIPTPIRPQRIPNAEWPSDHIAVLANIYA